MKRKTKKATLAARTLIVIAVLAVAIVVYFASSTRQTGQVDAVKIVKATRTFTADLKARGLTVPATVSLQELIDRGLLSASDVSAFSGMDVTVYLSAENNNPQNILLRARLPDGAEIVTLADGSVQQMSPNKRPK